jgi:putative OPT family oligopeptide transporter
VVLGVTSTLAIVVASAFFALVASYTVGQTGSTSNPVSGMTISGLLFSCAVLLPFRGELLAGGETAKVVLLVVAGVVCCAACTAGAVSQDLKTGFLLGASPRRQQWAMLLGTIGAALILQPLLMYLHQGYGIGRGLRAPQANVFKEIVEAFLRWLRGEELLYGDMILAGMGIGVLLAAGDAWARRREKRGLPTFRLYPMATAVGMYLGVALAVPVALGGLIALYVERRVLARQQELPLVAGKDDDPKNLDLTPRREYLAEVESHFTIPAAGLIAGEAIVGIVLAVLVALRFQFPLTEVGGPLAAWGSFSLLAAVAAGLLWFVRSASARSFRAARR